MTQPLTIDTLIVDRIIPADPNHGTPEGRIVSVSHTPCGDHTEWTRVCPYCEIQWTTRFDIEDTNAALPNRILWTDAERAAATPVRDNRVESDYNPWTDPYFTPGGQQ